MLDAHETKLEYQKWDYITLSDFRSKSCFNFFSYGWLWSLAIISVATFGSDIFTCVNLLAFNSWSGEIQTPIPLYISKWIFAGCILFSFVLLAYQWIRALRVMRRGNVAESYLDPLAVVLQSMRLGGVGKGWRRFLVFAALTKSKKGADYVALFSYFQFKGAIVVVLAEGPRQVINGMTLYSVLQANLIPHSSGGDHDSIQQFFKKIEYLYEQEGREQAIVLISMLFTFIVWVFSALCLIAAVVLYIGFLWHYIPREDGSLSRYCRRKVNTRLGRIVNANAKDAIAAEEAKRKKAEEKAAAAGNAANGSGFVPSGPARQPTLPLLNDESHLPLKQTLSRTSSTSSHPPPYSSSMSESGDGRQPTLPLVDDDEISPPPPQRLQRVGTESTVASNVTYGRRPPPPVRQGTQSTVASNVAFTRPPPPIRSGSQSTVASNVSYGPPLRGQPGPMSSVRGPPMSRPAGPPRSYTQSSISSDRPLLSHQNSSESVTRGSNRGPARDQEQVGQSFEMAPPQRGPTVSPPEWRSQSPMGERNPPMRPGMPTQPASRPVPRDVHNGRPTPPPVRHNSPGIFRPPTHEPRY